MFRCDALLLESAVLNWLLEVRRTFGSGEREHNVRKRVWQQARFC